MEEQRLQIVRKTIQKYTQKLTRLTKLRNFSGFYHFRLKWRLPMSQCVSQCYSHGFVAQLSYFAISIESPFENCQQLVVQSDSQMPRNINLLAYPCPGFLAVLCRALPGDRTKLHTCLYKRLRFCQQSVFLTVIGGCCFSIARDWAWKVTRGISAPITHTHERNSLP